MTVGLCSKPSPDPQIRQSLLEGEEIQRFEGHEVEPTFHLPNHLIDVSINLNMYSEEN